MRIDFGALFFALVIIAFLAIGAIASSLSGVFDAAGRGLSWLLGAAFYALVAWLVLVLVQRVRRRRNDGGVQYLSWLAWGSVPVFVLCGVLPGDNVVVGLFGYVAGWGVFVSLAWASVLWLNGKSPKGVAAA